MLVGTDGYNIAAEDSEHEEEASACGTGYAWELAQALCNGVQVPQLSPAEVAAAAAGVLLGPSLSSAPAIEQTSRGPFRASRRRDAPYDGRSAREVAAVAVVGMEEAAAVAALASAAAATRATCVSLEPARPAV